MCLESVLHNFVSNPSYKSLLIDGPWGCGKTYEAKEFIKSNKKKKIYYLSLFGLESIDEINTALYSQTKKKEITLKKGAVLLTKAIKAIPRISNLSDALEYQLDAKANLKVKKKAIIIFDDLERLSKKIQYIDLMGYINSLYLSGCRFVCLMSSGNIEDKRKKDFDDFKEKVFDCIYKISNFDGKVVDDLYSEFNLENISDIYDLFESNIRLAQKTKAFYKVIVDRMKKCSEKHIDFSDISILKACVFAVNICFKSFEYKPEKDDVIYKFYCEKYGTIMANNILYFKTSKVYNSFYSIPQFSSIVESLVEAFLFQNYDSFDKIYYAPMVSQKDSILDNEFYY